MKLQLMQWLKLLAKWPQKLQNKEGSFKRFSAFVNKTDSCDKESSYYSLMTRISIVHHF